MPAAITSDTYAGRRGVLLRVPVVPDLSHPRPSRSTTCGSTAEVRFVLVLWPAAGRSLKSGSAGRAPQASNCKLQAIATSRPFIGLFGFWRGAACSGVTPNATKVLQA
jgi:hypothetical protein